MKSKLVLLALMGALALGSGVPNAMAKSGNHASQGANTGSRTSSRVSASKKGVITKRHIGATSPTSSTK